MTKRVTLKDIARANDVHVSTVSRALDPHSKSALTNDVVEKIRLSARELGYRPNHLAAGLRTNKTMSVGILIPDITNTIFPPIVRGIESVLEPHGYASLLVNTDNQAGREAKLISSLLDRGVDGIIHAAVVEGASAGLHGALGQTPFVTVNRRIDSPDIACVISDDEAGIGYVLRELADHGHTRIGHIAGAKALSTGRIRRQAFEAEMKRFGLPLGEQSIVEAGRYIEADGAECARTLLRGDPQMTAIVCANDRLALGVLRYLQSQGLSCPQDISVTGFNDMPMLDLIPPGLTTVRILLPEAGRAAAGLLVTKMRDPSAIVPSRTILPVTLIRRGSVGRARTQTN